MSSVITVAEFRVIGGCAGEVAKQLKSKLPQGSSVVSVGSSVEVECSGVGATMLRQIIQECLCFGGGNVGDTNSK